MAAPKGNRFWEMRSKHGRDKTFKDAEALWKAAVEYFEWVEANPLKEQKAFMYQGDVFTEDVDLMRAMTIEGFCLFAGVNSKYLSQFEGDLDLETKEGKDFSNVICDIKEVIKEQKFTGAAAGLLNANIISRDLGLSDKSEQTHDVSDRLSNLLSEIDGDSAGLPNAD